jgi:hypothetical protein
MNILKINIIIQKVDNVQRKSSDNNPYFCQIIIKLTRKLTASAADTVSLHDS